MKTKIIPFDLETAKKIQAGEIEGRIVFCKGELYYKARVICFDRKLSSQPIVALYTTRDDVLELILICNMLGECPEGRDKLLIELPEEAPKHEFKPFDKVLVRNEDTTAWGCAVFSHITNTASFQYAANSLLWKQCIPYEGNEHLVGTTATPR